MDKWTDGLELDGMDGLKEEEKTFVEVVTVVEGEITEEEKERIKAMLPAGWADLMEKVEAWGKANGGLLSLPRDGVVMQIFASTLKAVERGDAPPAEAIVHIAQLMAYAFATGDGLA